jgi:ribosomal protein S18 acetylase RimI-like enzyme
MTGGVTFRDARREDARAIAELFRISSEGVADYVWTTLQDGYPGLSLVEIGERRYQRENTDFSYQNCLMVETEGAVVGMMHSYAMPDTLEPLPDDLDPVLRPAAELEIPGSLYISGLALQPDFRNRGVGTRLLGQAYERARGMGLGQVSLLVFEANEGAVRLYRRHGFREVDRRTLVPHPLIHCTGDVLLFATDVK